MANNATHPSCQHLEPSMSYINQQLGEINFKFVYYGPATVGKSSNMDYIYSGKDSIVRNNKVVLAANASKIVSFDFVPSHPMASVEIRGCKLRVHLCAAYHQAEGEHSASDLLKDADGVIFVADSQRHRMQANQASLSTLRALLAQHGLDFNTLPHVWQYNKIDQDDVHGRAQMQSLLNQSGAPAHVAVAPIGMGVLDTLGTLIQLKCRALAKSFGA
jgi:mutual gliding-motility protein MglA